MWERTYAVTMTKRCVEGAAGTRGADKTIGEPRSRNFRESSTPKTCRIRVRHQAEMPRSRRRPKACSAGIWREASCCSGLHLLIFRNSHTSGLHHNLPGCHKKKKRYSPLSQAIPSRVKISLIFTIHFLDSCYQKSTGNPRTPDSCISAVSCYHSKQRSKMPTPSPVPIPGSKPSERPYIPRGPS